MAEHDILSNEALIGLRRLGILVRHMKTKVQDIEFYYGDWTNSHLAKDRDCGTVGCMAGHCCTMPYFQRLGLRLAGSDAVGIPRFEGAAGFYAMSILFSLSIQDTHHLFSPETSGLGIFASRSTVIKHFEKYIARKLKERREARKALCKSKGE